MKRTIKRTKKGQFRKGSAGGPGRGKKKKAMEGDAPLPIEIQQAFFRAFMAIFNKSGNLQELIDFCNKNQLNQRLLIQEVRRLLPELSHQIIDQVTPLQVTVQKIVSDKAPDELRDSHIKKLEEQIQRQEEELSRLRGLLASKEIKLLEHYPESDKKDDDGESGGSDRVN